MSNEVVRAHLIAGGFPAGQAAGHDHDYARLRILEQLKEHPDYIFIPVGGGGLLAGISVYLKTINPKIKIVAVEAEDSACFNLACQFGKPTSLKHVGIFS